MATIIAVFQKYSKREGDAHKLKKSELRDLLHDELPDLLGVRHRGASEPGGGGWGHNKHCIHQAGRAENSPAVDFQNRYCCFTYVLLHTHISFINIYNKIGLYDLKLSGRNPVFN